MSILAFVVMLLSSDVLGAEPSVSGVAVPPIPKATPPPIESKDPAENPKLLNKLEIFTLENYPYWAWSLDEEGTVHFAVEVSATGAVTSCRVTRSSGSANLDVGTCDLITARGRFAPARDKKGRAVADSHVMTVTWQLIQQDLWRVEDSRTHIIYSVGPNLLVTDCRVEEQPPDPGFDPRTCGELRSNAQLMVAVSPAEFDWKDWDIVVELSSFAGAGDAAVMVGKRKDEMLFDRDITRMSIGPDGRIKRCETVELGTNPFIDKSAWCEKSIRVSYFEPASDSADRLMTSVTALYLRKKR